MEGKVRDQLIKDIIDVLEYRDGDYYVGGIASCHVCGIFGIAYGQGDLKKAIRKAEGHELRQAHQYLASYIAYMKKHPKKHCPHCGSIIDA